MAREIVFSGDQMSKQPQALYEKVLRTMADKYDIDINLVICHGKYEVVPAEMSFDKLYIFVQLLPKEFEGIRKTAVKGFKMNGAEIVFPIKEDEKGAGQGPCPQGDYVAFTKAPARAIILSDEAGVPMATILDGTLYIMNDFIHTRSKAEFDVGCMEFEYILEAAVKAGLIDAVKGGLEEKSKRSLEAALRIQFTSRLEKELVQLKAAKDTNAQYEKGITECTRKIMSIEKIVDAIKNNIDDVATALNKTWKNVSKMSGGKLYSNISYTKSGIKAMTHPITIDFQKKTYDIGRLEVTLLYDGTCRITNIDRRIDGKFDHPHVNDGNVCWGNFVGQIPKLIGSSEFDVALDLIYTFLVHYDTGNPYKTIEHWPIWVAKKPEMAEEAVQLEVRS